jgi:putative ABC transport system permease protein
VGSRFVVGRAPSEAEVQAGAQDVVLSEDLWRAFLGSTPALDRAVVTLDGVRHGVAGVVARGQEFPEASDVWIPAAYSAGSGGMRNNINFEAVARVRAGVSIERAQADLTRIALGIRETDPEALYSNGVGVIPLHEAVSGGARSQLASLMSGALFVLAIACANLAGLGLTRARRKEDELTVHLALGAGRARLLRRLAVEHAVFALVAGAAGLALASLVSAWLLPVLSAQLPRATDLGVDARIVVFGALVATSCALVTGLGPALGILRGRVGRSARIVRGRIRGGRGLPGAVMVGAEVALATGLLIGGGLLVRSFYAAASRPLGYEPENVWTLEVTLASQRYADRDASATFWTDLLAEIERRPDVIAAGVGNWIPTGNGGTSFVELEGGVQGDVGAGYRVVSDDYFQVMSIPVLRGRTFGPHDGPGTERVGLVSQGLADRYWPGEDPVGKRIKATSMEAYYFGGEAPWITVVGVVGDVRHYGFESDPQPELFVVYRQVPDWTRAMTVVVRTRPDAGTSPEELRAVVRALDPALAVEAASLTSRVRALLAERRLVLGVLWTFGALAILLSGLGIYALVSFATHQRAREIAIRAALGATRGGLVGLVAQDASRVVVLGLIGGVGAGFVLTRVIGALLFEVSSTDVVSYAVAAVLVGVVSLGAALVPSWRAARRDPLAALAE